MGIKIRHKRAVALLALSLILGGCWDHQPPEDVAFVLMAGFDEDTEDPKLTVVTQLVVLPTALAAGEQGGQPQGTPFYLLSNSAPTLESAQAAIVGLLSRIPRLEHLSAIVFGHEFARAGRSTSPAVSWALRHPQIRPGTYLFVADGSAQQFLDAQPALDPLPGAALARLMVQADRVDFVFPVQAYEFARTLLSPRIDGAMPLVGRVNPLAARVPADFIQQPFIGAPSGDRDEPNETQIQLLGMAIFKDSRMVGTLTPDDGSGLTWIAGDGKAMLTIPHPEQPEHYVVAVAIRSASKRGAHMDGDRLTLTIECNVTMDVWGEGRFEPMAVGKYLPAINRDLAGMIEKNVRQTMERLQELKADIFGFGEELYRSSPADWEKVAQVWDEVYADAMLDIRAEVTVRRTGLSR